MVVFYLTPARKSKTGGERESKRKRKSSDKVKKVISVNKLIGAPRIGV
jgi:hypothetical protein